MFRMHDDIKALALQFTETYRGSCYLTGQGKDHNPESY